MKNPRNFVLDLQLKKIERDATSAWKNLSSQTDFFPNSMCKFGAIAMHQKGYSIVGGIIILDNYCDLGKTKELGHFWNYDPFSRYFIDISAAQFNVHQTSFVFNDIMIWDSEGSSDFAEIYRALKIGLHPEELLN